MQKKKKQPKKLPLNLLKMNSKCSVRITFCSRLSKVKSTLKRSLTNKYNHTQLILYVSTRSPKTEGFNDKTLVQLHPSTFNCFIMSGVKGWVGTKSKDSGKSYYSEKIYQHTQHTNIQTYKQNSEKQVSHAVRQRCSKLQLSVHIL